jgi:hypothetical protein
MSTQSSGHRPRQAQGDGARQRKTERAFVIQFEPVEGSRRRLRGRVELVASGEATRFRSLKQLVDFMLEILRREPEAAPPA